MLSFPGSRNTISVKTCTKIRSQKWNCFNDKNSFGYRIWVESCFNFSFQYFRDVVLFTSICICILTPVLSCSLCSSPRLSLSVSLSPTPSVSVPVCLPLSPPFPVSLCLPFFQSPSVCLSLSPSLSPHSSVCPFLSQSLPVPVPPCLSHTQHTVLYPTNHHPSTSLPGRNFICFMAGSLTVLAAK